MTSYWKTWANTPKWASLPISKLSGRRSARCGDTCEPAESAYPQTSFYQPERKEIGISFKKDKPLFVAEQLYAIDL